MKNNIDLINKAIGNIRKTPSDVMKEVLEEIVQENEIRNRKEM